MSAGRAFLRSIALLSLAGLVSTALTVPAESHATLVRSIPAARASLNRPPERVQLWFSESLEPAFSSVGVWSASGVQVDRRDARVSPDDPKQLSVTLSPIEPGTYTVRCRVLSVDSHIVEASFTFTVKPAVRSEHGTEADRSGAAGVTGSSGTRPGR
ncbi:MAG TPA: copper resistance protein CopC [Candidatus Methylomirabilis sp.]|nr:copper resistance protein CopC [Candidatus Methylomirabilis sp.]